MAMNQAMQPNRVRLCQENGDSPVPNCEVAFDGAVEVCPVTAPANICQEITRRMLPTGKTSFLVTGRSWPAVRQPGSHLGARCLFLAIRDIQLPQISKRGALGFTVHGPVIVRPDSWMAIA